MRIFLLVLASILVVSFQLVFLPKLTVLTIVPNLVLAWVLAFAICQKEEKNYWWVLFPVLTLDLLIGQPFGLLSLNFCLVFFSVGFLADILFKKNDLPAILLLVAIGILLFEIYFFSLTKIFSFWRLAEPMALSVFYFFIALPVKIVYNGSLTLLSLFLIKKSQRFFYHESSLKIR